MTTEPTPRAVPWQIVCELRMTPDDAQSLLDVLDAEKHALLIDALGFQISDFREHGFTRGTLVLGLTE